jgi:DMSO reductase family type II enzyme heme b subunit
MKKIVVYGVPALLFAGIVVGGWWALTRTRAKTPAKQAAVARTPAQALYERECAVCHGTTGQGDGPAAYLLSPKPRDFTKGLFKVRSTPSGQLPTDADLLAVLERGMPGSAMPSFAHLTSDEKQQLLSVVKSFSPAFAQRQPQAGIVPPPPPTATAATLARGKDVFAQMQCASCHGESGRGDGPSSLALLDDWGNPIRPNDFTRGIYKGGSRDEDIYLRFRTGMTGTPMPAYEGLLKDEDIYAVVQYVKSLAGNAPETTQPTRENLTAMKVAGVVPEDPLSPAWSSAPTSTLPLMILFQRAEVTRNVDVKAVHNGNEVAIRLEWDDSQPNAEAIRSQDFSDGGAVQFALGENLSLTTLAMGATKTPVNLWYWKASRQMDILAYQDVEGTYPNIAPDGYLLSRAWKRQDDWRQEHAIPAAKDYDKTFLTGFGAGNPVSNPTRTVPMEDLNAEGFGTLTTQEAKAQNVRGAGVWQNGRWNVVFVRPMGSPDKNDAKFIAGKTVPVAFAVWDGGKGDRNGQKSVTNWNLLTFAP